jgi:hypothetical protein
MNSIPQHDVANGNGQREYDLAKPMRSESLVAKKPSPSYPAGAGAFVFMIGLLSDIVLIN